MSSLRDIQLWFLVTMTMAFRTQTANSLCPRLAWNWEDRSSPVFLQRNKWLLYGHIISGWAEAKAQVSFDLLSLQLYHIVCEDMSIVWSLVFKWTGIYYKVLSSAMFNLRQNQWFLEQNTTKKLMPLMNSHVGVASGVRVHTAQVRLKTCWAIVSCVLLPNW